MMRGDEELGGRIRDVRGDLSQDRFAQLLGVSLKTIQHYERGENRVAAGFLKAICEKFPEINPTWLLTGAGAMRPSVPTGSAQASAPAPAAALDEELLGLVVEGISTVYREEGGRVAPRQLGRLAARIHADLVAAYDTPEERQTGLKLALQQLRRDLRSPHVGEDSSKRLA